MLVNDFSVQLFSGPMLVAYTSSNDPDDQWGITFFALVDESKNKECQQNSVTKSDLNSSGNVA